MLRSPSFAGVATEDIVVTAPTAAADSPARTLVATRRIDAETLAFDAWGYSGTRTVIVEVPGFLPVEATFAAVGQTGPPAYPLPDAWFWGWKPIPGTGRVLGAGDFSDGARTIQGYAVLDLREGVLTPLAGLSDSVYSAFPKLLSPGTSARANEYLLDFSPEDSAPPAQAWRVGPGFALTRSYDVPCRGEPIAPNQSYALAAYAAAELRDSVCLTLTHAGRLLRNGSEEIWTDAALTVVDLLSHPGLAVAPQGKWATVIGQPFSPDQRVDAWPVVSADGRLAYTLDRLPWVRDAEFSADGDTLFVLAQTASHATGGPSTYWIEAIALASGARAGGVTLPDHPVALLADPERPWLFVLGYGRDSGRESAFLTVVDRRDWTVATAISTECYAWHSQPRTLVLDANTVHAMVEHQGYNGVCHFDIL